MNFDWLAFIEKFGIPLFILAFFAYFVAGSIKWLANNVILSLQSRHIAFLDKIEESMNSIKLTHNEIKEAQNKLLEQQEDIHDALEDISEYLGVIHDDHTEEPQPKARGRKPKE